MQQSFFRRLLWFLGFRGICLEFLELILKRFDFLRNHFLILLDLFLLHILALRDQLLESSLFHYGLDFL